VTNESSTKILKSALLYPGRIEHFKLKAAFQIWKKTEKDTKAAVIRQMDNRMKRRMTQALEIWRANSKMRMLYNLRKRELLTDKLVRRLSIILGMYSKVYFSVWKRKAHRYKPAGVIARLKLQISSRQKRSAFYFWKKFDSNEFCRRQILIQWMKKTRMEYRTAFWIMKYNRQTNSKAVEISNAKRSSARFLVRELNTIHERMKRGIFGRLRRSSRKKKPTTKKLDQSAMSVRLMTHILRNVFNKKMNSGLGALRSLPTGKESDESMMNEEEDSQAMTSATKMQQLTNENMNISEELTEVAKENNHLRFRIDLKEKQIERVIFELDRIRGIRLAKSLGQYQGSQLRYVFYVLKSNAIGF